MFTVQKNYDGSYDVKLSAPGTGWKLVHHHVASMSEVEKMLRHYFGEDK